LVGRIALKEEKGLSIIIHSLVLCRNVYIYSRKKGKKRKEQKEIRVNYE